MSNDRACTLESGTMYVFGKRIGGLGRQLISFTGIGALSTLAYIALYASLRPFMPATIDNVIAQTLTAVANTAANRRLTFGVKGQQQLARDHAAGLIAFAVALALTSLTLLAVSSAGQSGRMVELPALILANLVATAVRFILLREWIFQTRQRRIRLDTR